MVGPFLQVPRMKWVSSSLTHHFPHHPHILSAVLSRWSWSPTIARHLHLHNPVLPWCFFAHITALASEVVFSWGPRPPSLYSQYPPQYTGHTGYFHPWVRPHHSFQSSKAFLSHSRWKPKLSNGFMRAIALPQRSLRSGLLHAPPCSLCTSSSPHRAIPRVSKGMLPPQELYPCCAFLL